MSKPISSMIFFGNGNYCAFRNEQQVPEEQSNAWFVVLQDKLDRGVINLKTTVLMPGWKNQDNSFAWTIEELVKRDHLKVKS